MDKRRLRLHTLQRLTDWTTNAPGEAEWFYRSSGQGVGRGPVVELELGRRAAMYVLAPQWESTR